MLTPRQKKVLEYIKSYQQKQSVSPTLKELAKHFQLSSLSTAHHYVKTLQNKGYLHKEESRPRTITVFEEEKLVTIPVMGTIAAGQPIEAFEEYRETVAVPQTRLMPNQTYFALKVVGQSMIEENILDGDIVLVKQQSTAQNGQKIVALIDNHEATLKTFYSESGQFRLQPANRILEPIIIKKGERELAIQGIVVDIIKSNSISGSMLDEYNTQPATSLKYNQLPLNKIICGDAIEELRKIPTNSIDLVIADPPYWKVINEKWDYKWRTENDYIFWCKQWIKEIARVVKKTGCFYLFGYLRTLAYLIPEIERENFSFRQQLIIDKGLRTISGRATKNYKMFPNVTESILFFAYNNQPEIKKFLLQKQKEKGLTAKEINDKMEVKSNGGGLWSLYTGENILAQIPTQEQWEKLQKILDFDKPYSEVNFIFNPQMGFTDVWTDIDFYKEKRYHSTQKPVQLIERLIKASSNKDMIILDPFVGSGSTALACLNLGRNFIGIDIDQGYAKIAEQRIKEYQNTLRLF